MWARGIVLIILCITMLNTGFGQTPQAAFSSNNTNSGCTPLIVQFKDISTGGSATWWRWDFGNGASSSQQNPGVIYTEPGAYTITFIAGNVDGSDTIVKTDYIQVYGKPQVAFGAIPSAGCLPMNVQFIDSSRAGSGTIASYIWDFGDGQISAQATPLHSYTAAGAYDISLTVQNSYGCKQSLQKKDLIKVANKISAAYNYTYVNACQPPTRVQFNNTSTADNVLTYQWAFGDGATSTTASPEHVYNASGDYTATLIAVSANGCTDTVIQKITIGTVKAAFSVNNNACTGKALAFTNTSTPAPVSNKWEFGDGSASTASNAIHTYAQAGSYAVTLYTSFGNCNDSTKQIVNISNKPVTSFTTPGVTDACAVPATVAFTNTTSGAASYLWIFGDGGTSTEVSPSHSYRQNGYYTVTLISFNAGGCSDTLTKVKLIHIGPPRITGIKNLPYTGCTPATVNMSALLDDAQSVTSWSWNFGDGTSSEEAAPAHYYTQAGSYDVALTIRTSSGCTDTYTLQKAVVLATAPEVAFSANPLQVCGSKPFSFTDESTGDKDFWLWNFGDGLFSSQANPKHSYKDTGYFTITLIAGYKQCYDTLVKKGYVNVKVPIARFTANMQCSKPYERNFIDNSIGATSWQWNFGDGQQATTKNASHTYADTGTYTVQLVTWNDACSDTMLKTIYVADEHPSFTYTPGDKVCQKESIIVTATDYTPRYASTFTWSFGDNTTITSQSSTSAHTYGKTGNYSVKLTIKDINGCLVSASKPILNVDVYGSKAAFSNQTGTCLQNGAGTVVFTDKSTTDGQHPVTTWHWNFGDGDTAITTTPSFSHTYTQAGNYTVQLAITDTYGCQDTITQTNAVVIASPKAGISLQDSINCSTSDVTFNNTSQGLSLTYRWYFGDGQTATKASPSHVYNKQGQYSIALAVTDKYGCKDSIYKANWITIANPIAGYSITDTFASCPPLIAGPVSNSQNVTSLYWNFDDGTTSILEKPEHAYIQGGVYNLMLIAKGHGNCYDTAVHVVTVKGPSGSYMFTPNIACAPAPIAFKGTTKNTVTLAWDFGDGTVVSGADEIISHTYTQHGAYVPKLVLIDSFNCKVGIASKDTLFVRDIKPFTRNTLQTGCDSALMSFTDSTQVWYDNIAGYQWSFGDKTTSTQASPSHYYYKDGNYTTKLVVTSAMGCKDSVTTVINIPVYQSPKPVIKAVDSVCFNSSVAFAGTDNRSDTVISNWEWQYGNGQSATGQQTSYTYPYAGKYNVQLTATNAHGCTGSASHEVTVLSLPALDAGADTSICLGQSVQLQSSGADRYSWTGDGIVNCRECMQVTVKPVTGTRYYLKGSSNFGCISYDSLFVDVKQPPHLTRIKADSLCIGESAQLQVSGAETYQWFPATGLSSPNIPNPVATPVTTTTYSLVGSDTKRCFSDTQQVTIRVYPIPVFDIIDTLLQLNVGYSDTLLTRSSADVTSWRWVPSTGLSCATCPNPVVIAKQDITYTAHAFNEGGCTAKDEVTIHVLCNGINVFMPNTFSPNNDGMNDRFYPRGKGLYNVRALRIFNRWGQAVYEKLNFLANNESYGWDGTFGGQPGQSGVYVYVMEIECDNGTVMTYKGNVALLR